MNMYTQYIHVHIPHPQKSIQKQSWTNKNNYDFKRGDCFRNNTQVL